VIIDKDPNDNIDPVIHELKVPSGDKTGIKIVGGYYIAANQTTELILDFDACRSVVQAGSSGQWLIKPTIKFGETPDYSIIKGQVTDSISGDCLEGVLVSAQQYDPNADDPKDEVIVKASTLTDVDGYYSLFVEPGENNFVAFRSDRIPVFEKLTTVAGQVHVLDDISLTTSSLNGWIKGTVTISGAGTEQYATLSLRQDVDCNSCDPEEKIEIKALNVMNTYNFNPEPPAPLPTGQYQLIASSFGYATISEAVNLGPDETLDVPLNF
jgi:hypothetical protein